MPVTPRTSSAADVCVIQQVATLPTPPLGAIEPTAPGWAPHELGPLLNVPVVLVSLLVLNCVVDGMLQALPEYFAIAADPVPSFEYTRMVFGALLPPVIVGPVVGPP